LLKRNADQTWWMRSRASTWPAALLPARDPIGLANVSASLAIHGFIALLYVLPNRSRG